MNAINKALNEIKFNIPREILDIAFKEYDVYNYNKIVSLDEKIMSKVIRPRVLVDCNLISGINMEVDLTHANVSRLPTTMEYIIEIPKKYTNGKSILMPLELICNVYYTNTFPGVNSSPLVAGANNMYMNLATHNIIQTSRLELIGENTILVHDTGMVIVNGILRCRVEYDSNMSSLPPTAYLDFGQLCILAVKAYIYNNCKIQLDKGYITGGHELSSISEIIDGYSDANEQYVEHLKTTMRKILYITQSVNLNRFIKMKFGNTI